MSLNGGLGSVVTTGTMLNSCDYISGSAIAVGKLNSNNAHYLYHVGINGNANLQITRYTIDNTGTIHTPTILYTSNAHSLFTSVAEADLSFNNDKLAFNVGNQLFVLYLDGNGNVITTTGNQGNGLSKFTIGTNILTGVEFSTNGNNLFVGQQNTGVLVVDPNTGIASLPLSNSQDYGNSQLETAYDALGNNEIYVADGVNGQLGRVNTPNGSPSFSAGVLTGYTPLRDPNTSTGVCQLPDQIDNYDYSSQFVNLSPQCCIAVTSYDVEPAKSNVEQTGTQIWSAGMGNNPFVSGNTVTVKDKLIIKSGANVTITGMTFEFATNAQLIIERGANLTLDNCTLTVNTTCNPNAMWHGIEVWGTTGAWQPIPSNRGSLITKNNTLIEHAIVATANVRHNQGTNNWPIRNSFTANYTGGIIKSTNTIFRNNVVDTQFETFISTNGNNTYNDLSYFRNCHFLTDALLNNQSLNPFVHAFLRRVKGIKFQGCTFENTATSQYIVQQRGRGIYALESLFSVKELCNTPVLYPNPCPVANTDPCEFNNLTYGIIGTNLGNRTRTAQIMNNSFINNFRGIYIRNMDLAEITNNYMEVGADLAPSAPAYGMYFDGCDKYKVENNRLHNVGGTFGMYTINSGGLSNEIYRNDFHSFKTACQAAGKNGFGTTHPYAPIGLEYRCNYYSETVDYDILVSSGRIKSYQGNCSTPIAPANNQFSNSATQGDYWVNNAPSTTINSRYRFATGTFLSPRNGMFNTNNTNLDVCNNLLPYDSTLSCPQKVKKTKSDLVVLIGNLRVIIDNLTAQIDGGNTQSLITTINTEPAWKVKNELLAASPNLSDEVLLALLNSNMPDWVHQQVLNANTPLSDGVFLAALDKPTPLAENIIRDIAVASSPLHTNEQLALLQHTPKYADWLLKEVLIENSPLKDEVLIALMDKTPVVADWAVKEILLKNTPLSSSVNNVMNTHTPNYPNWMINQVNNSTFVADEAVDEPQPISPMIALSEEIGYYQAESDKLSHDLLRIFLFDEEGTDATIGDAIAFLDSSNCANSQCLLTCAYIDNGNYGAAQQTVNALSTDSANAAYCTLFNTVIQYEQMAQYEQELLNNGTLLNNVQSVANGTTQNPEVGMAAAILEAVYNQDFQETFEYVNNNNSQRTAPINQTKNTEISQVNIYPNPTKEQFTLSHNYTLSNGNLVIIVYDVMGRALISEQIISEQQVVNTTELKQGVYFYQVTQNNKNLSTGKLVIE